MRKIVAWCLVLLLASCSSTRFVDSWKNNEVTVFSPKKLLVIGITDNLTARKIFEEELRLAFIRKGINAFESTEIIDESFLDTKRSEEEIQEMTDEIIEQGFDAVAITAIKGVDDKVDYRSDYYDIRYGWYRFGRYWYLYQDVYHTPGYYSQYKVYHVETAVYDLLGEENQALVWVGSFDIMDPTSITITVDDYVERIIKQMERDGLLLK